MTLAELDNLFIVRPYQNDQILVAIERSMSNQVAALAHLPMLTNVTLGDPYLAEQLAELHRLVEIRPAQRRGLLARIRTRLGWWLLGDELRQVTATHATLVRVLDSLIVQLDQDRAARRRIEEHLAYEGTEQ